MLMDRQTNGMVRRKSKKLLMEILDLERRSLVKLMLKKKLKLPIFPHHLGHPQPRMNQKKKTMSKK
jgi:hypothetical protein